MPSISLYIQGRKKSFDAPQLLRWKVWLSVYFICEGFTTVQVLYILGQTLFGVLGYYFLLDEGAEGLLQLWLKVYRLRLQACSFARIKALILFIRMQQQRFFLKLTRSIILISALFTFLIEYFKYIIINFSFHTLLLLHNILFLRLKLLLLNFHLGDFPFQSCTLTFQHLPLFPEFVNFIPIYFQYPPELLLTSTLALNGHQHLMYILTHVSCQFDNGCRLMVTVPVHRFIINIITQEQHFLFLLLFEFKNRK